MANKNKCIQGHFSDKEHNGKQCPYDNMSSEKLSDIAKVEIEDKPKYKEKTVGDLRKHYDWAIKSGFVSPLISYEIYEDIRDKLHKIAIGKVAVDGTLIKQITNHCIDRVCGTIEKENGVKHEGVPIEDFEYTLFNGKVRKIIETNTIIFISNKCKIAINPKRGIIKQCNKC
jgi:hypothetical protein